MIVKARQVTLYLAHTSHAMARRRLMPLAETDIQAIKKIIHSMHCEALIKRTPKKKQLTMLFILLKTSEPSPELVHSEMDYQHL